MLVASDFYEDDLSRIVKGKARPQLPEASDTVGSIKVRMDSLPSEAIPHQGMAGLADCLWTQVV